MAGRVWKLIIVTRNTLESEGVKTKGEERKADCEINP